MTAPVGFYPTLGQHFTAVAELFLQKEQTLPEVPQTGFIADKQTAVTPFVEEITPPKINKHPVGLTRTNATRHKQKPVLPAAEVSPPPQTATQPPGPSALAVVSPDFPDPMFWTHDNYDQGPFICVLRGYVIPIVPHMVVEFTHTGFSAILKTTDIDYIQTLPDFVVMPQSTPTSFGRSIVGDVVPITFPLVPFCIAGDNPQEPNKFFKISAYFGFFGKKPDTTPLESLTFSLQ